MNTAVKSYLEKVEKWKDEVHELRRIVMECPLIEGFKWSRPCYSFQNHNIVLIHEFKNYCALLFFKGSLMSDPHNVLIQQTENSRSARQIRFTSTEQIAQLQNIIKEYIYQAMEVERAGLSVQKIKTEDIKMPQELKYVFENDSEFKAAFMNLTEGRRRGYLIRFKNAKQSKTRWSRIEKSKARIMSKKGLSDCICGLSKRMPKCDGSHQKITS